MKTDKKILYQGGVGEIIEKKSRFIATTKPVKTEEEALSFFEEIRKRYWDATHNCTAFVIGENSELQRCSDDGEPSKTAGKPMLDVLLGEGIQNIAVTVTRYFGGTLLGTGGLVKAYTRAVQEGLKQSIIVEKCRGMKIKIKIDYTEIGKIQYICAQMGIKILNSDYTDTVKIELLVPEEEELPFKKQVIEATNGQAVWEENHPVVYGIIKDKIELFKEQ